MHAGCARSHPQSPIGNGIDSRALRVHFDDVSKRKPVPKEKKSPGTIMAEAIRKKANNLSDAERESLLGDAMRIIYGSKGQAAHAHRR